MNYRKEPNTYPGLLPCSFPTFFKGNLSCILYGSKPAHKGKRARLSGGELQEGIAEMLTGTGTVAWEKSLHLHLLLIILR